MSSISVSAVQRNSIQFEGKDGDFVFFTTVSPVHGTAQHLVHGRCSEVYIKRNTSRIME